MTTTANTSVLGETSLLTLAQKLLDLYFVPDSHYYEFPVNVAGKEWSCKKESITIGHIVAHLEGKISIAPPSCHNRQAKWVCIDIDSKDLNAIRKAKNALREKGLHCYVSFSGGKGYHLDMFFDKPTPLQLAQRVSAEVTSTLDNAGIKYDKISPRPTGKGGDGMKLPLGIHPDTGNRCNFLDDNLQPVGDPISFLMKIEFINPNRSTTVSATKPRVNIMTGEIIEPPSVETISPRPCVNKLWLEGIQEPRTRHSATCVIANAIVKNPQILSDRKEQAVIEWVSRTYAQSGSLIKSSLDSALKDAKSMLLHYQKYGSHAELCENEVFKVAMRSACQDEYVSWSRIVDMLISSFF